MSASKTKDLNITEGSLLKKIIIFAIPLILTGLLQQFYNAADLIVVGMFEGEMALAAVGATGSLTNLFVGLFMGLSVGAGVSVAHLIGAKQYGELKRVIHTALPVAFVLGIAVSIIGIIFSPELLRMMDNPESIIEQSTLYIRIIFFGIPASMVYNYSASMLRSSGDAKRPLIFLSISGLVNVALNFILVAFFHMGVAGVAIATIASQYVSAAMVLIYMMRSKGYIRFSFKDICFDAPKLKKILYIGIPSGLQGCLFSVGNVMIQSAVNSLGDTVIAGRAAAANLEGFVYISLNALYHVSLTFVGQAVGAKSYRSIKKIVSYSAGVVVVIGAVYTAVILGFHRQLVGFYAPDNEAVLKEALHSLKIVVPTYFLCGCMEVFCGAVRAMGKSVTAMIVTLLGACGLRVLWISIVFRFVQTSEIIYYSYPISWLLTLTCHIICLSIFVKKAIKDNESEPHPLKKLHSKL